MSTNQPRRPAGTPAGGQWASAAHDEADIELSYLGFHPSAHSPIAYTYEAAAHCPRCAVKRFGSEVLTDSEGLEDGEGNRPGVVAPWSEWWEPSESGPQTLACDDCGEEIDTYDPN